ncbi:vWA domain-containing protein [Planctomycetota bacterium]
MVKYSSRLLIIWLSLLPVMIRFCPGLQAEEDYVPELKPYEIIQSGFQSRFWVVRSFAAIRAGRNNDLNSLRVLLNQYDSDSHERVKAFALQAISRYDRDFLVMAFDSERVSQWVNLTIDKNAFIAAEALVTLRVLFEKPKLPKKPRVIFNYWKKQEGIYPRYREKLLQKFNKTEAGVQPLPLPSARALKDGETKEQLENEHMRSVVPEGFGDYIRRLEMYGIYMCVLLDDTSSMDRVIDETRQRILGIMGLMKEITPKYQMAFVTYKDRVNKVFNFESEPGKIFEFLKGVKARGGADDKEGPDKALDCVLNSPRITWNQRAVKAITIIGDMPPHDRDRKKMLALARKAVEKDITVNAIGTYRRKSGMAEDVPFFQEIAAAGNGIYSRLEEFDELLQKLLQLSVGPKYQGFINPFLITLIELRAGDLKK